MTRRTFASVVTQDALGHVRRVTDSNGEVVFSATYDPWGNALSVADNVPGGWSYRYMGAFGCRLDADTGLVYCRQRWLDTSLQRFISRDAVRSSNRYAYAYNSPMRYIDSSGLDPRDPDMVTVHSNGTPMNPPPGSWQVYFNGVVRDPEQNLGIRWMHSIPAAVVGPDLDPYDEPESMQEKMARIFGVYSILAMFAGGAAPPKVSTGGGGVPVEAGPMSMAELDRVSCPPKTVGLGIDRDLKALSPNAITYRNAGWQRAGLTNVDAAQTTRSQAAFKQSFYEAAENATRSNSRSPTFRRGTRNQA